MGGKEEPGKIFVGGLSWNTDQDSLQGYFGQFGEITDCIVMKNPQTGKSRGFGFVSFKDSATVDVILSSKSHIVDGRTVDAKACNARGTTPKPQSRGGGGGGGGGGMTGRTTKIFIGGLPNNVDDDTIREAFSRFGTVTEVVIMFDHEKGRSRGFGFLTFDNEDSVEQACMEHYVDVSGKQVECKKAEPRGAGGRGGGGAGRGGGRGGGPPGGFGGQGWGGGPGGQQGNWNQGWNQDFGQQGWGGQQSWGGQGNWNANGWNQGMCGMQQGGPSFGAMPMNMGVPNMGLLSPVPAPDVRAAVGSGDGSTKTHDGCAPMQSTGQGGPQGMGGYGGFGPQGPAQGGQNMGYGGYGQFPQQGSAAGGYGDNQQGGYGQQTGYGAQQGGYGAQPSAYGGAGGQQGPQGGSFGAPQANGQTGGSQGMGGGYQQRQAPGNTSGGSGRGGGSQNFHPYSR